jgi:hypothetical protein
MRLAKLLLIDEQGKKFWAYISPPSVHIAARRNKKGGYVEISIGKEIRQYSLASSVKQAVEEVNKALSEMGTPHGSAQKDSYFNLSI